MKLFLKHCSYVLNGTVRTIYETFNSLINKQYSFSLRRYPRYLRIYILSISQTYFLEINCFFGTKDFIGVRYTYILTRKVNSIDT